MNRDNFQFQQHQQNQFQTGFPVQNKMKANPRFMRKGFNNNNNQYNNNQFNNQYNNNQYSNNNFRGVKRKTETFNCATCGIEVNSLDMWNSHLKGQKHAKRVKQIAEQQIQSADSNLNQLATPSASANVEGSNPDATATTASALPATQLNENLPSSSNQTDLALNPSKSVLQVIHELAIYHKLKADYTLEKESGPPHAKLFEMKLVIGSETYNASGTSLNKAKHAVAEIALNNTKLEKPTPEQMKKRRAELFQERSNNGEFTVNNTLNTQKQDFRNQQKLVTNVETSSSTITESIQSNENQQEIQANIQNTVKNEFKSEMINNSSAAIPSLFSVNVPPHINAGNSSVANQARNQNMGLGNNNNANKASSMNSAVQQNINPMANKNSMPPQPVGPIQGQNNPKPLMSLMSFNAPPQMVKQHQNEFPTIANSTNNLNNPQNNNVNNNNNSKIDNFIYRSPKDSFKPNNNNEKFKPNFNAYNNNNNNIPNEQATNFAYDNNNTNNNEGNFKRKSSDAGMGNRGPNRNKFQRGRNNNVGNRGRNNSSNGGGRNFNNNNNNNNMQRNNNNNDDRRNKLPNRNNNKFNNNFNNNNASNNNFDNNNNNNQNEGNNERGDRRFNNNNNNNRMRNDRNKNSKFPFKKQEIRPNTAAAAALEIASQSNRSLAQATQQAPQPNNQSNPLNMQQMNQQNPTLQQNSSSIPPRQQAAAIAPQTHDNKFSNLQLSQQQQQQLQQPQQQQNPYEQWKSQNNSQNFTNKYTANAPPPNNSTTNSTAYTAPVPPSMPINMYQPYAYPYQATPTMYPPSSTTDQTALTNYWSQYSQYYQQWQWASMNSAAVAAAAINNSNTPAYNTNITNTRK